MTKTNTIEDIPAAIEEKRNQLQDLRVQLYTNELKDVSQIRKTKKEIARLLTQQSLRKVS